MGTGRSQALVMTTPQERVLWLVALSLSLPPVPAARLQAWAQAPCRQAAPALAPQLQKALTLARLLQELLTALQLARAVQLRRCAPVDL